MVLQAPVLRGPHVLLEPLRAEHAAELWAAAREPEVWRYMTQRVAQRSDLDDWIRNRLRPVEEGRALAFCQRDLRTGEAAGATSLFDIDRFHRRMEIGFTWLGKRWWGSGFNREAKQLLLDHAFGAVDANRVQLKTDARNLRAQRAIERLGATRQGLLRRHDVLPDGHIRDVVIYSLVRDEWPSAGSFGMRLNPSDAGSP